MKPNYHNSILRQKGLQKIGELKYEFLMELWWDRVNAIQVSIINLSPYYLLKATKHYFMVGTTESGETYSRDLNGLTNYLAGHIPIGEMKFFFYRDLNSDFILRKIQPGLNLAEDDRRLESIKGDMSSINKKIQDTETLLKYAGKDIPSLNEIAKNHIKDQKEEFEKLKVEGMRITENRNLTEKLLKEYKKKGISAGIMFCQSSTLQAVCNEYDFKDALHSIVKEIIDIDRYEVSQILNGGRLNIFIEEVRDPVFAFQVEYSGILNPNQLQSFGEPFEELRDKVEQCLSIYPTRDIVVDGHVKHEKKLLVAKQFQNFISRLDKVQPHSDMPVFPSKEGGWLGNLMAGDNITSIPVMFQTKKQNIQVSGKTQSGKSVLGRGIVENSIVEGNDCLMIDPTRQGAGIGLPADGKDTRTRYEKLGLKPIPPRGFRSRIYTPKDGPGLELPDDLTELFSGTSIVSLKDCTDKERCEILRNILQAIYDHFNCESEHIELTVVIEETASFLPENTNPEASDASKECRSLLIRIAREKLKFGVVLVLITQSTHDLRGDARILRDQIDNRFFLKCRDPVELDYIERWASKEVAATVKEMNQGEAYLHTPDCSDVKFFVRPPLSKIHEVSDDEIREINKSFYSKENQASNFIKKFYGVGLNKREHDTMILIRKHYRMHKKPILATELDRMLKIKGGSRQRILDQLENKKFIRKVEIKGNRGRPSLGIIPME